MSNAEFFEDDLIRFRIEDGILYTYYRKGASIDLDGARKIVKNRLELLNGRILPMILLDEGIKEVKREARIYLSEGEGVQGISACAFVVTNPFTKVIVQFFLALNAKSNAFPVKTFSNEADGLNWLDAYR